MNAASGPGVTTHAAARAVTLPCARKWPRSLDGRVLRPIRGTWHPHLVRQSPEDAPYLVPIISCPRCARQMRLVLNAEAARLLSVACTTYASVGEDGAVTPEPRCECGWYAPTRLEGWNQWHTLFCAMVLEGNDPLMRAKYVHAADAVSATHAIARIGRRIVSLAPVIRNDREMLVLP